MIFVMKKFEGEYKVFITLISPCILCLLLFICKESLHILSKTCSEKHIYQRAG